MKFGQLSRMGILIYLRYQGTCFFFFSVRMYKCVYAKCYFANIVAKHQVKGKSRRG